MNGTGYDYDIRDPALAEQGADLVLCASIPISTQDDVAAALAVRHEIIR